MGCEQHRILGCPSSSPPQNQRCDREYSALTHGRSEVSQGLVADPMLCPRHGFRMADEAHQHLASISRVVHYLTPALQAYLARQTDVAIFRQM